MARAIRADAARRARRSASGSSTSTAATSSTTTSARTWSGASSSRAAARPTSGEAMAGVREAAVVAAAAVRPAVNGRRSRRAHGRRSSLGWRCRACRLRLRVRVRPRRRADSIRRVSAITSTCRRGSSITTRRSPRSRDDCCGGEFPDWTAIIRWPVTRHWVNAHPIGDAILHRAVLRGRARAHAVDQPLARRLHALLPARRRTGRAVLDRRRSLVSRPRAARVTSATRVTAATLVDAPARHEPLSLRDVRQLVEPRVLVPLFAAFLYLTDRWHDTPSDPADTRSCSALVSRPHRPGRATRTSCSRSSSRSTASAAGRACARASPSCRASRQVAD